MIVILITIMLLLAWGVGYLWAYIEHKARMRKLKKYWSKQFYEMFKEFSL